jgi:hypothetical protein
MYLYNTVYTGKEPELKADWYDPVWNAAETAELLSIRPESSSHAPRTRCKLLYNGKGFYGIFTVDDNYFYSKAEKDMDSVWLDNCVEFFVKPAGDIGYFNFEFNCLGILYASYIRDNTRTENGFKDFDKFSADDCTGVMRASSLKGAVTEGEPFEWNLQFFIPIELIKKFTGKAELKNEGWACNFYKCADNSSHPHWISWAPVKELNFHAPADFGKLTFIN